jgi:serine phosphatase RsbU (regulator of sigma subunit)
MGLGLEDGPTFEKSLEEKKFVLNPGDMVVLYSDGLTESMDTQMEEFGEERLFQFLETKNSLDALTLQNELIEEAQMFKGPAPQHDDLTLVVVKIREG